MTIQFEISEDQLDAAKWFMLERVKPKISKKAVEKAMLECEEGSYALSHDDMVDIFGDSYHLMCITMAATVLYQTAENNGDIRDWRPNGDEVDSQ